MDWREAPSILQNLKAGTQMRGCAKAMEMQESEQVISGITIENRDYNRRNIGFWGWFMSPRGKIALPVCLLLVSLVAHAAVKKTTVRIKVLDFETRSYAAEDNGVPKNCDGINYDAYCRSTTTAQVVVTLLVQEGDETPFRIRCRTDARWSRCTPLERGASFDAKREKHGLTVYYVDDKGAVRKQLYTYVEEGDHSAQISAGGRAASSPAALPTASAPPAENAANGAQVEVKCSFTSTPPGAEVAVDGRYVGSTPSALDLSVGNHTVEVSLPGFEHWKRDLAVTSGSQLTVNAVLEKVQ